MSAGWNFLLGFFIGGSMGIFIMCLMQIGRLHENQMDTKEKDAHEKND